MLIFSVFFGAILTAGGTQEDFNAPLVAMQGGMSRLLTCNRTWYISERETILIESPGFGGTAGYPRGIGCTWRIYNNRCNLIMNCPKFRLSDLLCWDYMEIQDYNGISSRHCGLQRPVELSLGRFTTILFKSSTWYKFPLTGFRCKIQCEENSRIERLTSTTALPAKVKPSNCTCGVGYGGKRKSKIINGTVAYTREFPWVVAVVTNGNEEESGGPFCGGALISSKYILTAAHCVQGPASRFQVMLNYNPEAERTRGTGGSSIRLPVDQVIMHPKYNSLRLDYDAALIKLRIPFELNDSHYTVPVCLPELKDRAGNLSQEIATVIGWGATAVSEHGHPAREPQQFPVSLHKVDLSVLPDRKCQELYPARRIKPEKMCAYSAFKDSCEGDSGGPLMMRKNESDGFKMVQIGIVSSGSGCARLETPGIYIKTSEILTWISINTRDSSYCMN